MCAPDGGCLGGFLRSNRIRSIKFGKDVAKVQMWARSNFRQFQGSVTRSTRVLDEDLQDFDAYHVVSKSSQVEPSSDEVCFYTEPKFEGLTWLLVEVLASVA